MELMTLRYPDSCFLFLASACLSLCDHFGSCPDTTPSATRPQPQQMLVRQPPSKSQFLEGSRTCENPVPGPNAKYWINNVPRQLFTPSTGELVAKYTESIHSRLNRRSYLGNLALNLVAGHRSSTVTVTRPCIVGQYCPVGEDPDRWLLDKPRAGCLNNSNKEREIW